MIHRTTAAILFTTLLTFASSCADAESAPRPTSTSGPGAGGGAGAGCDTEKRVLLEQLAASAPCTQDSDCAVYLLQCLQVESGNCAGHFWSSKANGEAISTRTAAFESCMGRPCGGAGMCGLGAIPACREGSCR